MKEICERLINSGKTVMNTIKGHRSAFNFDISNWIYRSMISYFCINRSNNDSQKYLTLRYCLLKPEC